MNVLIIGAGAIGCLVGGKLAHSGHQVTFGSRPRFVEAIRGQGLVLMDETGRHVIGATRAAPSIGDAFSEVDRAFDLAVLTVKSYDTTAAVGELYDAVQTHRARLPPILSLQNGVGNEETIVQTLGEKLAEQPEENHEPITVLAGVITTPVSAPAPAIIQVDRPSYHLGLSVWDAGSPSEQAAAILHAAQDALTTAGFRVRRYAHAQGLKWTKLLMNMMGNALCAILDMPPDRLLLDARLADLEIQAWREALQVMARAHIPPVNLGSYPFAVLAPLIRYAPKAWLRPILSAQVGKARGGKMPSLHMDLHRARENRASLHSEVEWLNGAIVRQGEFLHVSTPVNRLLTTTFLHLLHHPEEQAEYRQNPARLLADLPPS